MAYENGTWIPEKGLWPLEEALKINGMTLDDLQEWTPGSHTVHVIGDGPLVYTGMGVNVKRGAETRFAWAKYDATPEEIAAAIKAA